jgi:hypothetical protein
VSGCSETLYTRQNCSAPETPHALTCAAPHAGTTYTAYAQTCDGSKTDCAYRHESDCKVKAKSDATQANCVGVNGGCVPNEAATFDAETKSLIADLSATLANLTAYADSLFQLADVGLSQDYLGVFQKDGYPYSSCSFNYPYAYGNAGYTAAALSPADAAALTADAVVDGYARNAGGAASAASASANDAVSAATKRRPAVPVSTTPVVALVLTSDVKAGLPAGAIQHASLAAALPGGGRVVSKRVKCKALLAALQQGAAKGVVPSRNVRLELGAAGVASATLKTPTGATLDLLQCKDNVVVVATKAAAKA